LVVEITSTPPISGLNKRQDQMQEQAMRDAAQELEATFLAEMLKSAGVGETPEAFGGGAGEDQFASMLRLEQARQLAATGGIGLAEAIFNSLKENLND
jgi:Rod binding domain-containing protein